MLLEYRVSNYKSIGEEQVLSLVADDKDDLWRRQNCTKIKYKGKDLWVNKFAALYGANASGKTNFLNGLFDFWLVVQNFNNQAPDFEWSSDYCMLNKKYKDYPTKHHVKCFLNEKFVQYEIAYNSRGIVAENLEIYNNSGDLEWKINRQINEHGEYEYIFASEALAKESQKNQDEINQYSREIHAKILFVNFLAIKNITFFPEFKQYLSTFLISKFFSVEYSRDNLFKNNLYQVLKKPKLKAKLLKSLKIINPKIVAINISTEQIRINNEMRTEPAIEITYKDKKNYEFFMNIKNESHGTMEFIPYIALFLQLNEIHEPTKLLVIDEIDRGMHPHLLEFIMKQLPKLQKSQVIFTNHAYYTMQAKLMRKDQIFLVNRDENDNQSQLKRLSSFSYHEKMNKSLWHLDYYNGSFGAVPDISTNDDIII